MPAVRVVFFQRAPGDSPVVQWLRELNRTSPRAFDKCRAAVAPARRRPGMPRRSTTDATRILAGIAGPSAVRRRAFAEECAHREVARRLYALRKQAGVSQAELARRVGTTQSVISRLEDADYGGHSLALLQRIAAALERRVEIRFVARRRPQPV